MLDLITINKNGKLGLSITFPQEYTHQNRFVPFSYSVLWIKNLYTIHSVSAIQCEVPDLKLYFGAFPISPHAELCSEIALFNEKFNVLRQTFGKTRSIDFLSFRGFINQFMYT